MELDLDNELLEETKKGLKSACTVEIVSLTPLSSPFYY